MNRKLALYCTLFALGAVLLVRGLWATETQANPAEQGSYPILFVTQIPIPDDYITVGAVFGNHNPAMQETGRGGDLWIRYPNGIERNLTELAGYGHDGFQDDDSIAVRDPAVHWDGDKALFSMVIGAPEEVYQWETYHWQIYEITGLGQADTPLITKLPNQPANFNNISPIYGTDDRIIFTSDRPRNGATHLHPQLDEYELEPTNTGLWSLDPADGDLRLLNHAPSGNFTPIIDSYGRVIFTQWDHLQRDQLADVDALTPPGDPLPYGTFNYTDESADATPLFDVRDEVYPEPRSARVDLLAGTNLNGHRFNHFFPWQINEDGTELETLIHIGRQELHDYLPATINDDPNVIEYYGQYARFNPNSIENMLHIQEDPNNPGRYYATNAPEFYTHSGGQIFYLDNTAPTDNPDYSSVSYITHPDTADFTDNPSPDHSGLYRDILPLTDGSFLTVHTAETRADYNDGSRANPISLYDFRIKTLVPAGNGYYEGGTPLTNGISKSVTYYDPDVLVTYSGELWELQPVEVRPRTRPGHTPTPLPDPEQQIFAQAGVSIAEFQLYLIQNNLALIVSRNVTARDDLDLQQPYNLRIFGTDTQTIGASGTIYDLQYLQLFQADQIRGLTGGYGNTDPEPGRRVLAQPLHDPLALLSNPPNPAGPAGSVVLGADGSMAAIVPAQRALSWQLTAPDGTGIVRERYWLTFQPGEIRVCAACHGLNETDQAGGTVPENPPQALLDLLGYWQLIAGDAEKTHLPIIQK